ncbi:unnamed protein product, partial [Closterium sp. NIES-54]
GEQGSESTGSNGKKQRSVGRGDNAGRRAGEIGEGGGGEWEVGGSGRGGGRGGNGGGGGRGRIHGWEKTWQEKLVITGTPSLGKILKHWSQNHLHAPFSLFPSHFPPLKSSPHSSPLHSSLSFSPLTSPLSLLPSHFSPLPSPLSLLPSHCSTAPHTAPLIATHYSHTCHSHALPAPSSPRESQRPSMLAAPSGAIVDASTGRIEMPDAAPPGAAIVDASSGRIETIDAESPTGVIESRSLKSETESETRFPYSPLADGPGFLSR